MVPELPDPVSFSWSLTFVWHFTLRPVSYFQKLSFLRLLCQYLLIIPFLKKFLFIYFFGYTGSQLWYTGSSVAACGIWFPDKGLDPGPLYWEQKSQPMVHQGSLPIVILILSLLISCPPPYVCKCRRSPSLYFSFSKTYSLFNVGEVVEFGVRQPVNLGSTLATF